MKRDDTYRHKGLRMQMVENLRQKGISDESVLRAMSEVPRHWFIDSALDTLVYEDRAIRIGCDQTISHPSTVAMQSQLLSLQLGILTVPEEAAQSCADLLVEAGVRGLWNFSPVQLDVPPGVVVQNMDLAQSLAVLSHSLETVASPSRNPSGRAPSV